MLKKFSKICKFIFKFLKKSSILSLLQFSAMKLETEIKLSSEDQMVSIHQPCKQHSQFADQEHRSKLNMSYFVQLLPFD